MSARKSRKNAEKVLSEVTLSSSEAADVARTEAPGSPEPVPRPTQSSDSAEPEETSFVVENADVAIRRGGEKFYDYYALYKNLRELAKPLNGLPYSAPMPNSVSIKKIVIEFTANGEDLSVELPEPQKTGDIAALLSFAIRDVVEKMNNELHILSYLVSGMHSAVQTAFNARVMAPPPGQYDNTNTKR